MFVKYNWINDLYINTKEWPLNVSLWEVIDVYNEYYINLLSDFSGLFEPFDETSSYYVRFNKWTWVYPNPSLAANSPQNKIWLEIDISSDTTEADVTLIYNDL